MKPTPLASNAAPAVNWLVPRGKRIAPRELPGRPAVVLRRGAPVDQPVALLAGLVLEERVADAAPERKRRIAGVGAGGRDAGVAGRRQRGALGGAGLVDRLIERVLVDVAVERRGVDVSIVGVTREHGALTDTVARADVDERRSIVGDVGFRIHAGEFPREELQILEGVADQRIVGVGHADGRVVAGPLPPELAEQLADLGRRVVAPPILLEADCRTCTSGCRRLWSLAAVLEFD